jgi:hypothetical protein
MPEGEEEHPGAKKNAKEALTDLYIPSFLVWGCTGHVIYS